MHSQGGLTSPLACLGARGQKTCQDSPARMIVVRQMFIQKLVKAFFPPYKAEAILIKCIHDNDKRRQTHTQEPQIRRDNWTCLS